MIFLRELLELPHCNETNAAVTVLFCYKIHRVYFGGIT
jgi:hypothetical protein